MTASKSTLIVRGTRRPAALLALLAAATLATGCASGPEPLRADGSHCYRNAANRRPVCTTGAVPDAAADAQARQLAADPVALTVYVLRRSRPDTQSRLALLADGRAVAETVPSSLVRLRLAPGRHALAVEVDGHRLTAEVSGQSGGVQFLHLDSEQTLTGARHAWRTVDEATLRPLLAGTRLVADVQAR